MQRGRKILRCSIIAVIICLFLLLSVLIIVPLWDNVSSVKVAGSESWMSKLDDSIPINLITLPGTHNSTAQYTFPNVFLRCQAESVDVQLNNGIRYLDIRIADSAKDPDLFLSHSFSRCRPGLLDLSETLYLQDILDMCYEFLSANPSETIVFCAKHEYGPADILTIQNKLNDYISISPEFWYLSDTVPSLGEARGKIVLLRRWNDEAGLGKSAGIAADWIDQGGHDNTALSLSATDAENHVMYIQDRFEYGTSDKWSAFTAADASKPLETDPEGIFVNFLSTKGTFYLGHPHWFAKTLNGKLAEYAQHSTSLSGWVVIDYEDAEISSLIYSSNFN